jgi:hypothetical protein
MIVATTSARRRTDFRTRTMDVLERIVGRAALSGEASVANGW